jgi:hypothetical protein
MPETADKNTPAPPNKTRILYPFLVAIFPPLSLYSQNLGDARPVELLPLMALMLLVTGMVGLALRLLYHARHPRAAALLLCILPFFAFGQSVDLLRDAMRASNLFLPLALFLLLGAAWLTLMAWLGKTSRDLEPFTRLMNNIALCAVALAVGTAAMGLASQYQQRGEESSTTIPLPDGIDPDSFPDIYYLIPDSYTRADYLKDAFDFDNTPFLDALRERGFYIADRSQSNYPRTQMSLAASLNMDYLDPELLRQEWNKALPLFVGQIWDNTVLATLTQHGYDAPTFSSGVAATEVHRDDARFVKPRTMLLTEFQQRFLEWTPLRSVIHRWTKNAYGNRVLFVLEELSRIRRNGKPMFLFAHMMSPHIPHQFDENGRPWEETPDYFTGYVQETKCLNKQFLRLIDAILARQPNSIFILQGDHGPHTDWRDMTSLETLPWEGSREDWIRDKTAILNAYYFPDQNYEALYPEITPVNSFRVLFNQFFGAKHPPLPDNSYLEFPEEEGLVEISNAP